jgi:hypothetical protein
MCLNVGHTWTSDGVLEPSLQAGLYVDSKYCFVGFYIKLLVINCYNWRISKLKPICHYATVYLIIQQRLLMVADSDLVGKVVRCIS